MKFFTGISVYDAAIARIEWLFDEFENVVVSSSGGKDSTVVFNLAMQVARRRKRLPLKVLFIDQEAEWDAVIDYQRALLSRPDVQPYWLQVPIILFNATSTREPWLKCWEPGKESEWVRAKEPNSIHENKYGTDRFGEIYEAFSKVEFGGRKTCVLGGVRAEESPARTMALTAYETYKGETWGRKENDNQITFYPIYDWSYTDVWKAIHDNGWPYCALYDYMYQYGIPTRHMRVSNVHHETAVKTLFFLQEIEPQTWARITARISGINTAGHLRADFFCPAELPPMFASWREYRDYLLENLLPDGPDKTTLRRTVEQNDKLYIDGAKVQNDLVKTGISVILTNDFHRTKFSTFAASHGQYLKNKGKRDRG